MRHKDICRTVVANHWNGVISFFVFLSRAVLQIIHLFLNPNYAYFHMNYEHAHDPNVNKRYDVRS